MDRKRRSRRFRISNLRQRGRIIVWDMAAQIFVNPALRHISPSRRPIGPVIGPRTIYTSNWYRPALRCRSYGSSFRVMGDQRWWGDKMGVKLATQTILQNKGTWGCAQSNYKNDLTPFQVRSVRTSPGPIVSTLRVPCASLRRLTSPFGILHRVTPLHFAHRLDLNCELHPARASATNSSPR